MSGESGTRRELFVRLVRSGVSTARAIPAWELAAVFLAPPALLVGLHLLPGTGAWRLSLAADSPFDSAWTLWTAFASSYVHADLAHLANNVGVYLITVTAAYALAVQAGWRRRFAHAAVVYLLAVPFVGAWVSLATLGQLTDLPAAGFSGVNSAFLGFLPVAWVAALARHTEPRVDLNWSAVAFCGSLALVFALPAGVAYFRPAPGLAVVFGAAALVGGVALRDRLPAPPRVRVTKEQEFVLVYGASAFLAGVLGSMVVVTVGTNVWAHLAGYVFGFGYAFFGFVAVPTLER